MRNKIATLILSIVMMILLIPSNVVKAEECKKIAVENKDFVVEYSILEEWENYYTTEVRITNIGKTAIYNWALMFELDDNIMEIWGASEYSKEDDIYILKNSGYKSSIEEGETVIFGFKAEVKEDIKVPESFKIPVAFQQISEDNYVVVIDQVNDYEVRINVTNTSQESFLGWGIEFEDNLVINSNTCGEIKEFYGMTNIQSYDYNYEILPNETKSISLYVDEITEEVTLNNISVYEYRIVDINKYKKISFESQIDVEATNNFITCNNALLDKRESIIVNIRSIDKIGMNDSCKYEGNITFMHSGSKVTEKVAGELTLCQEGVFGNLCGRINDEPFSVTINYAFQNKQPYAFLSVGSLSSGNDYYKVYGLRQENNDKISTSLIETKDVMEENLNLVESEKNITEDIMLLSVEDTDYDCLARKCKYKYFTFEDASYYLGAISLYCPIKTKSNCVYTVAAKVNTQDNNAQYYFREIMKVPGMFLDFDSTADVEIYTVSKYVDILNSSPESSQSIYLPISIAIPVGDYVSFDLLSISIPGNISREVTSVNSSPYKNKCSWKFKRHYDADISDNNALTTETGYGGYIEITNNKNSNHTYTFVTNGTIYYQMKTQLVNYIYDSTFNVDLTASQSIKNYPNN